MFFTRTTSLAEPLVRAHDWHVGCGGTCCLDDEMPPLPPSLPLGLVVPVSAYSCVQCILALLWFSRFVTRYLFPHSMPFTFIFHAWNHQPILGISSVRLNRNGIVVAIVVASSVAQHLVSSTILLVAAFGPWQRIAMPQRSVSEKCDVSRRLPPKFFPRLLLTLALL